MPKLSLVLLIVVKVLGISRDEDEKGTPLAGSEVQPCECYRAHDMTSEICSQYPELPLCCKHVLLRSMN